MCPRRSILEVSERTQKPRVVPIDKSDWTNEQTEVMASITARKPMYERLNIFRVLIRHPVSLRAFQDWLWHTYTWATRTRVSGASDWLAMPVGIRMGTTRTDRTRNGSPRGFIVGCRRGERPQHRVAEDARRSTPCDRTHRSARSSDHCAAAWRRSDPPLVGNRRE
jgi:hypothetical protein